MTTSTAAFGPRDNEVSVDLPESFDAGLYFIGIIRTPFRRREDCPRHGTLSDAICTIEVFERYAQALHGVVAGGHLHVLYWMHCAPRNLLIQCPRHHPEPRGTFALRSPVRPNPIALSVCPLLTIAGRILTVQHLDCLDGTPLLDLKPYHATRDAAPMPGAPSTDGSPAP